MEGRAIRIDERLIDLDGQEADRIAQAVPGGAANVQDVYPLAPLQEGLLFHHMFGGGGDAYVVPTLLELRSRRHLDAFIAGLQRVIDRHDALRTAVLWEQLSQPVQVVYRQATLPVEELTLDRGLDPVTQLRDRVREASTRLDLRRAPLIHLQIARDPVGERWYALLYFHHVICDATSLQIVSAETLACVENPACELPQPAPYRDYIARVLARSRVGDAETFFRAKLSDVVESSAPFGMLDVHGEGLGVEELRRPLGAEWVGRLRMQARRSRVSVATLFHAAWALVVAKTSRQETVVYGTVLSGGLPTGSPSRPRVGMYLGTLPLRLNLADLRIEQLVQQTQRELIDLMKYEHVPLSVARRCSGIEGSAPLFTTLLNFRRGGGNPDAGWTSEDLSIRMLESQSLSNYPVALTVDDLGEELLLTAQTVRSIPALRVLDYMTTAIQSLVEALEKGVSQSAGAVPVLPEHERRTVVEEFNHPACVYPSGLLHERFEEQVARTPDAVAVVFEGESLSYAELNARANRLARYLRSRGVGPERRVGICLERGLAMVVGVLGILKAGGAYVPLDPDYPAERLAYLLADAVPSVVLTQSHLRSRLPTTTSNVVELDLETDDLGSFDSDNLGAAELALVPENLAYVIYTSGSTGQPKGVMVEHRHVMRLFAATEAWFRFNERDVWTLFHSFAFDFSVWELWSALLYGGRLVVVPYLTARSPQDFYRLLCEEGVTVLNQTPSAFTQLIDAQGADEHQLRLVIFGGEALELHKLQRWVRRNGVDRPQLVNMYGITETTVHVTYRLLSVEDIESERASVIGRPIPDLSVYVLDPHRRPVPIGVAGEMYVGGAGVARGYLNREALTSERFVIDPFSGDPTARLYRSGDLARWRADGTLEYLGRNDHQVKIRGYRIELGEIEAELARHPHVKQAVVTVREDAPGQKRLVAYVVPSDATPSAESMRAYLEQRLPSHMVPASFATLDRLPLTAHGKLDRAALPAPDELAVSRREYVAPRTSLEKTLCDIWAQVLNLPKVGIEDNFFALGGDSILSLRVLMRAQAAAVSFSVADLFRQQTIAKLAATIAGPAAPAAADPKVPPFSLLSESEQAEWRRIDDIEDAYPLSLLQEGMYFHSESAPGSSVYHDVFSYSLEAEFHRDHFEQAVRALVQRHPVLRTSFRRSCEHRLLQVVHRQVEPSLQVNDIAHQAATDQSGRIRSWIDQEKHRGFVWSEPPLLRFVIHVRGARHFQCSLSFHHAILDGWSVASLQTELINHYVSLLQGRALEVSAPSASYRDFIAREKRALESKSSREYWLETLRDVTRSAFPGPSRAEDTPQIDFHTVQFDAALAGSLDDIAREADVHLKLLLLAAHVKVMSVLFGESDVLTGMVSHGRLEQQDGDRVLGLHLNTLPLRVRLGDSSWRELILSLRDIEQSMLAHRHYPLAAIQQLVRGEQLFDTLFNFTRFHVYRGLTDAVRMSTPEGFEQTNFGLVMNFSQSPRGEAIALAISFDPQKLGRAQVERLGGYYATALARMAQDLDARHHAGSLLGQAEEAELLRLSGAAQAYPVGLIHERFEEQVSRTPDAVAVVFEGESLSYAELNARANRLARYLRSRGVGPERRVGICLERGLTMVVGVLGILKAGGAYVPLDPDYPAERLAYLLADAVPSVVLTQSHLRSRLPTTTSNVVELDLETDDLGSFDSDNLGAAELALVPENLAYVIYTSGSTGQPKGVMVEHRHVMRLFAATEAWFHFDERDVWTLFHSFAFDFSVWELWGALLYGGRLVVVPYLTARSPQDFYRLLCEEGVTVLNQTPSAFTQLIDAQGADEHQLRLVIFGGEALELHKLQRWVRRNGVDRPQLVNMYGITETTVHVTYRLLSVEDIESERASVIGRPIPDLSVYVLDPHRRPVPIGVAGEMYVGGAGVARGYLNREALTSEHFIRDPFSHDPKARLYRSGDLARWRADGTLEYLGRNDHQVKIRGYRIELGEIEAELARHPHVKQTVVTVREDAPGQKRLVAYVVPSDATPSAESMRAYLEQRLPSHMVPASFVTLDRLPLTAHGKLDRAALPAPDEQSVSMRDYVAPRTSLEKTLCDIWAQVLNLPKVGIEDNFFALGGDSILSLRVLMRAQAAGLSFSVADLFRQRSIAELAHVIEAKGVTDTSAPAVSAFELLSESERVQWADASGVEDAYPLSLLQEGMYFHSESAPDSAVYHDVFSYSIEARFHRAHFERAVRALAQRHPVLRTSFQRSCDHRLLQVVHDEVQPSLEVNDLTGLTSTDQDAMIHRWIDAEKHRGFVWNEPPLLRFVIHVREARRFQCNLSFHHAILDGWSVASLQTELINHYVSLLQDQPWDVPAPVAKFRDFIARERQALGSGSSQTHWAEFLRGASRPSWPPVPRTNDVRRVDASTVRFDESLGQALERTARVLGIHLRLLLLAAHVKVLSVMSGDSEVLTGVVSHGRLEQQDGDRVLGLHLNTLPLRAQPGDGSWRELILGLRDIEQSMLTHRHYPLAAIQQQLRGEQLFDTLFNFTRFHVYRGLTDAVAMSAPGGFEQTNFSLVTNFSQAPRGEAISLSISFDPQMFGQAQVARLMGYYERALRQMVEDLDASHDAHTLIEKAEVDELRRLSGASHASPDRRASEGLVHERFEEQVACTPDAVAIEFEAQSLSYAQLNAQANQMARYLRNRGVGPGRIVGICIERGLTMVIGVLGVLKAGGAYVPLDPDYPADRLAYLLADATPSVVLTQPHLRSRLPSSTAEVVELDREASGLGQFDAGNLSAAGLGLTPENLAYVIYTSGSTGQPKGVMVEHRHVMSFWQELELLYAQSPCCQRIALNASLSFDASVQQLVLMLSGRTVCIVPEAARRDPSLLLDVLARHDIDAIDCTPSQLKTWLAAGLLDHDRHPLRVVLVAGEAIDPELWERLSRCSDTDFYNVYGPTECTVDSTLTRIQGDQTTPHIGRPMENTCIHVLDRHARPAPMGAVGEICIGGAGVTRGYLNRPDLTQQRFVPDPFREGPHARLYRTGDLGRWRADGMLEFLGRNDHQVKIRGYRIELGEIEAQLARHELVKAAVVVAREDVPGEKRLVAYVVPAEPAPEVRDLRAHLKLALPDYMVPAAFVMLERLPLTPTGKLDRAALPGPHDDAFVSRLYEAPEGDVEQRLALIWTDMLGVTQVSRDDHFFELGGHSLLGMKLVARIAESLCVQLPINAIFQQPTIRRLAGLVESQRSGVTARLAPRTASDRIPLTFSQQYWWKLYGLDRRHSLRTIGSAMRFAQPLNLENLRRTLAELVRRHEALRTRVVVVNGIPEQQVMAAHAPRLDVVDLTPVAESERDIEARRLVAQLLNEPVSVTEGPLFAARLLNLGEQDYVLALAMEHIISDAASMGVLWDEFLVLSDQAARGVPFSLEETRTQFADYAVWQRRTQAAWADEHATYWKSHLAGARRLRLFTSDFRVNRARIRWGEVPVHLDAALTSQLTDLTRRERTTLVLGALAVFVAVVLRMSGKGEMVVPFTSAGRLHREVERTIGYFGIPLFLRVELRPGDSFAELLRRITAEYAAAMDHHDSCRVAAQNPDPPFLFNPGFNWIPQAFRGTAAADTTGARFFPVSVPPREDVDLDYECGIRLSETEQGIGGVLDYRADLVSRDSMESFLQRLVDLARRSVRTPHAPLQ